MNLEFTIRVPGSSANLGPGFDVLGLALEMYLDVCASEQWRVSGPHSEGIPSGESNLILQAFRRAFERAGKAAPDVALEIRNDIPLGRGLGSSGAAVVAGVALANRAGGLGLSPLEELALAAEVEGHPDNVAASCLGGLAIACPADTGIEALRLDWPAGISLVIAVPDAVLETSKARAALPPAYGRADAVFNLQRLALLVGAVASGRAQPRLLTAALRDRLHQPYRAPLVPGLREALEVRAEGLLGVALSGAGPSLIAFVEGSPQPTIEALRRVYDNLGVRADVRPVRVDNEGARMIQKRSHPLGT